MAKFPRPPDQDNFNVVKGVTTVAIALAGGAPRTRRDQLGAWAHVACQWTCGPEEFEEIMTFYETELVEGSLPFTIDLYMNKGLQLTEHQAYFTPGTFKLAEQRGWTFVVQAELEANPKIVVPPPP